MRPRTEPVATVPLSLLIAYGGVVVYGTLFPIGSWRIPEEFGWRSLLLLWPERISRTDLLTNVLIYLPVGGLWVLRRPRANVGTALVSALLVGSVLSYTLECVQLFLPRVPSRLDLLANTIGSALGGVVALWIRPGTPVGRRLHALRETGFVSGRVADVALLAVGVWMLSQWAPLVPSADLGNLKHGLRPLWNTLSNPASFALWQALGYTCAVLGLAMLTATVTRRRRWAVWLFAGLVPGVLLLKVPILTRQLSAEAIVGSFAALLLLWVSVERAPRRLSALVLIVGALLLEGLRPGSGEGPVVQPINWIPFASHSLNLFDFTDLLGGMWPFLALACAARQLFRLRSAGAVAVIGGTTVAAIVLAVEGAQQYMPGRTPDITDVLTAVLAWSVAWLLMSHRSPSNLEAST